MAAVNAAMQLSRPRDYKLILIWDAIMSACEIACAAGSVEHWNPARETMSAA